MTPVNRFFRSALFPLIVIVLLVYLASQTLIPQQGRPGQGHLLGVHRAGQVGERCRRRRSTPTRNEIKATLVGGDKFKVNYPSDQSAFAVEQVLAGENVRYDSKGRGLVVVERLLILAPSVRAPDRLLDLPDEPGPGRRLEGDELRQVAREADDARLAEDRLQGRGRRRRGRRGAARDQGVPREPEEVPGARRADPQGRPALRASRHR